MTAPPTPQPKPTTQTTQTNTSAYTAALAAIFSTYRRVLSPIFASSGLGQCRYLPTCSEYAHIALVRYGPLRGSLLAAARLLRCHPWAAGGLDPVPDGPHAVSPRAAPQPADHEVRP